MRVYANHKHAAKYTVVRMLRAEALHLSAPFGMLERIRSQAPDGAGLKLWVGPSPNPNVESIYLWIPNSVVNHITREAPGNPAEAGLKELIATHVAHNPGLEKCLLPLPDGNSEWICKTPGKPEE